MKRNVLILAAIALSTLASAVHAEDFSTDASSYWGESYTDSSGNYQSPVANTSVSGGVLVAPILTDGTQAMANAGFPAGGNEVNNYVRTFSNTPPIAASPHYDGSLLGDLSGKTYLTATFNLTNSNYSSGEQFQSSDLVGEGFPNSGNTGPLPTVGDPSIRLTFSGADPSNEWWSTTGINVTSMDDATDVTLTTDFDPADWSNTNGINGAADTTDFDAALANVSRLGLSFGSGDFYSNGFAFNTGTGTTASIDLDSIDTVTVPLPASAWSGLALLGGLGLLGGVKRMRRQTA